MGFGLIEDLGLGFGDTGEDVPANAILTESGEPMLTETGEYILMED